MNAKTAIHLLRTIVPALGLAAAFAQGSGGPVVGGLPALPPPAAAPATSSSGITVLNPTATAPSVPVAPGVSTTVAPGTLAGTSSSASAFTGMAASGSTVLPSFPYPNGGPAPVANPVGPVPPAPAPNPQPPTPLPTFGAQMFSGRFAGVTYSGFNADYQIALGDRISVQMWGAVTYGAVQSVDAQGNLFIPDVGPVHVQGVRNGELTQRIGQQVGRTYRAHVGVYATLVSAQPVKVYVTGFVRAPGLYPGLSSDSVLYYLDRASGIDPDRGSYLGVEVLRHGQLRARFDLYRFLLSGHIDEIQLQDGDTIVVGPRRATVSVYGNVTNPYRFELPHDRIDAQALMALALPLPGSTHLSVVRLSGLERQTFRYPIDHLEGVTLLAGDQVDVTQDQSPASIVVQVTGAQLGDKSLVLPLGAAVRDLVARLTPSPTADLAALQLFRPSVAAQQKASIDRTLDALQTAALTTRNADLSEAQTRSAEAAMILGYIDRARSIVPRGQVVLTSQADLDRTLLMDGDTVHIPDRSNLVTIGGEVQLPNTLAYQPGLDVDGYVALVGGFTQRADRSKVVVIRENGSVAPPGARPQAGDEILVLPVIQTKVIEVASGITSILYQLAVAAGVLTRF